MEGAGDPRVRDAQRAESDLRVVLAGALIALLIACLALPIGGDVVTGGKAWKLILPQEGDSSDAGAFVMASAQVRHQALGQWLWEHTLGGGLLGTITLGRSKSLAASSDDPPLSETASGAWLAAVRVVGPVVEVTAVRAGTPADRAGLHPGDAIITIDGRPPMRHTLDVNLATGHASRLRVYRAGQILETDLVPIAPWPQPPGGGATYVRRLLTSPPPALELGKVRGGSAGLVLALAYVDVLTAGDLTGHRLIAATGALGPGGSVDPVMAYGAKIDAAARVGAKFFLMPRPDIRSVEPFARGRTTLVPVSSVEEAVLWLCAKGGESTLCTP
jgi:PDZ domain-containing protein